MINMIWPIAMVVTANVFYNIIAKYTPESVNPLLSLTFSYLIASALAFILFLCTKGNETIVREVSKLNWTSIAMGAVIIALEFGYIFIYRNGWDVHVGPLVANAVLACVLIFVGALLFKERITPKQIAGIGICIGGLILINI